MLDKIKKLKFSNILLFIFIAGFVYFLIVAEREGPENAKEQVEQQEPWLLETNKDIYEFMNDDSSSVWVSNTGVNFLSIFSSSNFSYQKLISLQKYLLNKGWQQLSMQSYATKDSELATWFGISMTDTVLLCKDKATVIIWMYDLKEKYDTSENTSTMIDLIFDYRSPCYEFDNKND